MNRLKELRKEKKLTQKELADIIGVSKITVLRWENGERQIKSDKAQALSDFFGVEVAYLLGYDNQNERNKDFIAHVLLWTSQKTLDNKLLDTVFDFLDKKTKSSSTNFPQVFGFYLYLEGIKQIEDLDKHYNAFLLNRLSLMSEFLNIDKEDGDNKDLYWKATIEVANLYIDLDLLPPKID